MSAHNLQHNPDCGSWQPATQSGSWELTICDKIRILGAQTLQHNPDYMSSELATQSGLWELTICTIIRIMRAHNLYHNPDYGSPQSATQPGLRELASKLQPWAHNLQQNPYFERWHSNKPQSSSRWRAHNIKGIAAHNLQPIYCWILWPLTICNTAQSNW